MLFFWRKYVKFVGIDYYDFFWFRVMFISVFEIFDCFLYYWEVRINVGLCFFIKVVFENFGRCCFFVLEWCGMCMNMILWNLLYLFFFLCRLFSDNFIVVVKRLCFKNSILNIIYWLLFCCFLCNKIERRVMICCWWWVWEG